VQKLYKKINCNGHFDSPLNHANYSKNDLLIVSGWVIIPDSKIESLELVVNGKVVGGLTYKYPRPDVEILFPGFLNCGFYGIFSLEKFSPKKNIISLAIKLGDGSISNGLKCEFYIRKKLNYQYIRSNFKLILGALKKGWVAFKGGRLPLSPFALIKKFKAYKNSILANQNINSNLEKLAESFSRFNINPYEKLIKNNNISKRLNSVLRDVASSIENKGVLISVICPVYNPEKKHLEEMLDSVLNQIYPKWELCLIDDASTKPYVKEVLKIYAAKEPRIKVKYKQVNSHISDASNCGLKMSSGDYIALLDHDDLLSPDALIHFAMAIVEDDSLDWLYSDEDKINDSGVRYDPLFKGAWNPEMALTHNYTHHLTVIRAELIRRAGSFRVGFEGAQDLDLFLRVAELTTSQRIKHIPFICYHWRSHPGSTASDGKQKTYIEERAAKSISEALERRGVEANPFLPSLMSEKNMCLHQLRWDTSLIQKNQVTIVIPTRDKVDLLRRCITSLERTVDPRFVKLIIVDDASLEADTKKYLQSLQASSKFNCQIIHLDERKEFNYSRLVNIGAAFVTTPLMLQLNNDVEAIEPGWLEDMVGWMSLKDIGVVGAKLLYPDKRVQHAGVVVGPHGGLADHLFHLAPSEDVGYAALLFAARDVTAVTGACLLTKIDLYRTLRGFDEDNFAVAYNDVDYCIRVRNFGQRVVYTPQAELMHITSASRGSVYNPKEHINFIEKYSNFRDQYFNKIFQIDNMQMVVDSEKYLYKDLCPALKIIIFSHNLNLGGAPIVISEIAAALASIPGNDVTIVSPSDGPLKERIEKNGIKVRVLENFPNIDNLDIEQIRSLMMKVGVELDFDSYDVVLCNTITTYWGVIISQMYKKPVIWHIHESIRPGEYIHLIADRGAKLEFIKLLESADKIVFQSNFTRELFENFNRNDNFVTIQGGLPLNKINNWVSKKDRSSIRQAFGFSKDDLIITLIGTTCERKGQHIFLEAINLLRATCTDRKIKFLIVGAIPGAYLDGLNLAIKKANMKNVYIMNEVEEIYDIYFLSDAFVCTSYMESFPMVVLLAMAFKLPVFSTDVYGIPEIITDKVEGHLFKAGDARKLSEIISDFIRNPASYHDMTEKAYAKVTRLFDNEQRSLQHIDLVREVFLTYGE
jgi:glycosyltransferase involved in cell wall biosynthesis/GT2 family glycosyltransferase